MGQQGAVVAGEGQTEAGLPRPVGQFARQQLLRKRVVLPVAVVEHLQRLQFEFLGVAAQLVEDVDVHVVISRFRRQRSVQFAVKSIIEIFIIHPLNYYPANFFF